MASLVHTPEIHPGIAIAHSGMAIGNVDPRFTAPYIDQFDTHANRQLLRMRVPQVEEAYVIVPKASTVFADVDNPDHAGQFAPSADFDEIEMVGDGLITTRQNVGLMMNTADCIPLVLAEPDKNILSLIHLGWKGAAYRLDQAMIDYMEQRYGFEPKKAVAYIGPSISGRHFRTDKLHPLQEEAQWQPHIKHAEDGKFEIDIPSFVTTALLDRGVPAKNITVSDIDTGEPGSEYFSFTRYKRDGEPDGRNPFIALLPSR